MPASQTAPMRQPDPQELPDQSPHYTQSVGELGEERAVIAHEDVYAANGMKLFAKGARINRSQIERLNLHKLRVPLDMVLSTEDSVDPAMLASDANRLLADDTTMARMAGRSGDPQGFRQGLGALEMPPPLAFRLTVMREKRAGLYQHTLRVALITHAMGVRLELGQRDLHDVLLAAICHDIGEMHTDPLLLASGHRITAEERRFIHVHPLTGFVILRDMPGIPPATMQAVLHHHERLDGSGYPYSLKEAQIHPLAKLLCVAEVMEAVIRRGDAQRTDVLLRLNQRRLDPQVVEVLRELLRADANTVQPAPGGSDASVELTHILAVLAAWPALEGTLAQQAPKVAVLQFLAERMTMLKSLVLQSGINPDDGEALLELAREDSEVLTELQATLSELGWLLLDIANEVERRTVGLDAPTQATVDELMGLLRVSAGLGG